MTWLWVALAGGLSLRTRWHPLWLIAAGALCGASGWV